MGVAKRTNTVESTSTKYLKGRHVVKGPIRAVVAIQGRRTKRTFLSDGGERAPRMAEKACWRGVAGP